MIVEEGTGAGDSNSYGSEGAADAYFEARGNTTWTDSTGDKEGALVRATTAIDAIYGSRFPGWKVNGRSQALQWPRSGGYDANGDAIADDEVPAEIKAATFEAALRELTEAGSMMPDLDRGGALKRLKADTVELEWFGSAPAQTTFSIIEGILAPLLGVQSQYTARAVRA